MPLKFWQEAFSYATYIINRVVSPVLNNKTRFELLYSSKPNYSQIKVFGCECYRFLRPYNKHKFDFHTSKCILLGVSITHKGYVCMYHSWRIYISASVKFNKNSFHLSNDPNFSKKESINQNDFAVLLDRFRLCHFLLLIHEQTQSATTHSHSQNTFGNMEYIPNFVQNETQHNPNLDIMSNHHSPLSHSAH